MGRPCKLTKDIQQKLVGAVAIGATYELAAKAAGISYETMRRWQRSGETGEEPFCAFLVAIKEAEWTAAALWLEVIDKAAQKGAWQAAAWKLERRYPEMYAKRDGSRPDSEAQPRRVIVMPAKLDFEDWTEVYGPKH